MAAPTTSAELLGLLRACSLIDQARLEACVAKREAAGELPAEPSRLAPILVQEGVLTFFQAGRFLVGHTRGLRIGKYKILERLGIGGVGNVYLCEHPYMRRGVAVKVLPAHKAEQPALLARFYREAYVVATLNHPNIVRAHDVDQEGGCHFLVMEYMDGTNLRDLVKKFGPMDVGRACHCTRQVAEALDQLHRSGLVHRDVKPANILVDRQGTVKILDLGLARVFDDSEGITRKHDHQAVLGTADFLSPEQARDSHEVDVRADIYSLGATFYYLLAGHPPFPDGTLSQKLMWHQTKDPESIRSLRPEVPAGIETVLRRMIAKAPEDRYQMPIEVVEALAEWTQTPVPRSRTREMPLLSPAARAFLTSQSALAGSPPAPAATSNGGTPTVLERRVAVVAAAGRAGGGDSSIRSGRNGSVAATPPLDASSPRDSDGPPSTVVGKKTAENPRPVLVVQSVKKAEPTVTSVTKAPAKPRAVARTKLASGPETTPKGPTAPVRTWNARKGWILWTGMGCAALVLIGVALRVLL
jgi:serine/threonine protein kinase